ncbi:MAG: Gfo/Idh/MocA family oxidoreductase [Akkermansiaceae bacterium]|nr:Gfo/Idh/MocA family oxidoreductase [Armatimonadota bacterium]
MSDIKKPVRIGFVGVGGMGQAAHLRNYATLDSCKVVALAELRPGLAAAVAARWGVPKVYSSAESMIASENLDGIVASQPFDRHGEIIPPLYQAGLPILTEKPLASSVGIGERMLEALRASGSWHMVGYHKRSDPATMYAKTEIDRLKASGGLGKLKYIRITMPSGDWIANGFMDYIHSDEPVPPLPPSTGDTWDGPYVEFVNYYIHQVNLLRHLYGEPYRVTFADPTQVLLVTESVSGVPGVIEMTPFQTTLDWQETALVAFERGWVKLELPAPLVLNQPGRVSLFIDEGAGAVPRTVTPQMPWVHAMRQQASNFVAAIRGECAPMCRAEEALEDLKIARAYRDMLEK